MQVPFQLQSIEDYHQVYAYSKAHPLDFWSQLASYYQWMQPWHTVCEGGFDQADVRWFSGAKLNITANCLDRHLPTLAQQPAFTWVPNDPREPDVVITYAELHQRVQQMAWNLSHLGVSKGDRVAIYMPMIPETVVAMLACARLGAIHTVVFAGFSAQSLADRINDANARLVICTDGMYRGDKTIDVKSVVDEALTAVDGEVRILVVQRTGSEVHWRPNLDFWLHELEVNHAPFHPVATDAEDVLFILYTSGSTGKPKGVVHTTGGYMVYAGYSFSNVFQYQPGDLFWCTADLGWITGHTYLVYGPLLAGAHSVIYEGVPVYPNPDRCWQIIERLKVNQFYTAPTLIRSLMALGPDRPSSFDMPSLKLLGTVGEPINEEAWHWYYSQVGKDRCALVDTWWQTETGGILLTTLGNIMPPKPTFAGLPLPGVHPKIIDPHGNEITDPDTEGLLVVAQPWPSMIRTTWGDHPRCISTYFSPFKGYYFTGDGARRDEHGYFRISGRVDDVINVSGHRLGTAEIENAVNEHPIVVESAVVGVHHPIKGQGICVFAICNPFPEHEDLVRMEIAEEVSRIIGKIAKPDQIWFVKALPKTRSGKIMRRILRKIAEGHCDQLGDTSTLLDPSVVDDLIAACKP